MIESNKREIKERNAKYVLDSTNKITCESFILICVEVEDNLCFLIQTTEAQINQLYSYIEDNKKKKEEEAFNYKDTLNEESYLLVHILDASNFIHRHGSESNYVFVNVQLDQNTSFRTTEMPVNSGRILWNEPLKM